MTRGPAREREREPCARRARYRGGTTNRSHGSEPSCLDSAGKALRQPAFPLIPATKRFAFHARIGPNSLNLQPGSAQMRVPKRRTYTWGLCSETVSARVRRVSHLHLGVLIFPRPLNSALGQFKQTPCYPLASKPLISNHWHTVPICYNGFAKIARFFRALRTMRPRHAVLLTPSKSSHPTQLLSRQRSVRVSPLAATFMVFPASVANKRLTVGLSPLDATLTKNRGEGVLLLLTRSANQKPSKWLVSRTTPPCRSSQPTCPGPVGITLSPCLPYPLSPYPQSPCYHHPAAPNPHSFLPDRRSS